MKQNNDTYQTATFYLLSTATIIFWSLISHPWGATPLLGLALFSKKLAPKWGQLGLLIPAITQDAILGFHATSIWVYAALLFIGQLSTTLQSTPIKAFVASLIFFSITNFGVWYSSTLYPLTFDGLLTCYWAGLPYISNLIISTIATSLILNLGQNSAWYLTIKKAFSTLSHI